MSSARATIVYLFGPSGCGKSTVGEQLAAKTGGVYLDGDDYHPPANKEKMGAGIPLRDEDRWPWFENIAAVVVEKSRSLAQPLIFVACSALKRAYRDRLRDLVENAIRQGSVNFAWLDGSKELIASRIADRQHEYMPASLLDSQFAAFEQPTADEDVVRVSIDQAPEAIVAEIAEELGLPER